MSSKKQKKNNSLNSIRTKLIFMMAAVCIIPLLAAIIVSYVNLNNVAIAEAEQINLEKAEYIENDFSQTIDANFNVIGQLASSQSTKEFCKDPTDETRLANMVKELQKVDESFGDGNSTVVTGVDGQNIARSKGDFTNIAEREYFQIAVKGSPNLSKMSISKTTGARIIVPAVPIFDDDGTTVIGVLTRNFSLGYLMERMASKASEGQEIFITDADGIMLVDSVTELGAEDEIDLSYRDAQAMSKSNTEGTYIESYEGTKQLASYVVIPSTGWLVNVSTQYDVIMAGRNRAVTILIILGVVLAIIAVVAAVLFGSSINKPILLIDDALENLADGRFKDIRKYTKRKDEFGAMIRNTNLVTDTLRDIVDAIRDTANELDNNSTELAGTASQISDTMDDISRAVQDVASGATQQADEIQQATESIAIISGNIDGVTGDAEHLANTAESMNNDSRNSESELHDLERSSAQMEQAIQQITTVIGATSHAVDNISTKVEAIDTIASQTSLLALNASIEAARAGEAGRGFAVVAEEIGKLATDSANSANDIKEEMNKLLQQSQAAVRVADEVSKTNKLQYETIVRTVDSIQNLINGIGTTVNGVGNINNNAAACNDSKIIIVDAMNNLSAISEENAASTEETSASMQELNASVNYLASEASAVKASSDTLMQKMEFFKD